MNARSYAYLAAVVFTVIAALQFLRAVMGWQVTFLGAPMPIWPSWIAFVVAGILAWLGFSAARN